MMMSTEMEKLIRKLGDKRIPFELAYQNWTDSIQVWYPNKENPVCDAISHRYSYGGEIGLLEIMGLLTENEAEFDYVVGWLTADEVFERISCHYCEHGD